jgi:molybdenum cofactor biosynthesis enzyme MoaA
MDNAAFSLPVRDSTENIELIMEEYMQRAFISYDARDLGWVKNFAVKIQEKNIPIHLNFDTDSLKFGDNILAWMESNIQKADVFFIILSRNYASNISFARLEYEAILHRHVKIGTKIIPVYKERLEIDEIPLGLAQLRSIYRPDDDQSWQELLTVFKPCEETFSDIEAYVPEERRIRIQVTTACTQTCDWCHNDQFSNELGDGDPGPAISNIIKTYRLSNEYPRPRLAFTFTGGEPLSDPDRFLDLIRNIPKECMENSYLITNGRNLSIDVRSRMLAQGLINIRLSFYDLRDDSVNSRIKTITDPHRVYFEQVCANIRGALTEGFKLRLNHVLIQNNQTAEIDSVLRSIDELFLGQIVEVAFIQQYPNGVDIFQTAEMWCKGKSIPPAQPGENDRSVKIRYSGKHIEFIKVNCDFVGTKNSDRIKCLQCIIDRDVSLTSDGRICVCTAWSDTAKPEFSYPHFDIGKPLIGISAAIRKQYARIGFYCHFERLARRNNDDHYFGEGQFAGDLSSMIKNSLNTPQLYMERFPNKDEIQSAIRFCELLIKDVYSYNIVPESPDVDKFRFNCTLLCIIYLCVDERQFSTGRTIIAQGLTIQLLQNALDIAVDLKDSSTPSQLSEFILVSAYCIATIGNEICSADTVEAFLASNYGLGSMESNPFTSYILGCIRRQQKKEAECIRHLGEAFELSQKVLENKTKNNYVLRLAKEIMVDALRSKGAVQKNQDGTQHDATRSLQLASYYSVLHNTKLNYAASFSEGYYELKRYFDCFPDDEKGHHINAYRHLHESILQNPYFYASLIRIGILDLALGNHYKAIERAEDARRVFLGKGILSDLEYVNFWLNELLIVCAIKLIMNGASGAIPYKKVNYLEGSILTSTNIGLKDATCAKNDALYLKQVLSYKKVATEFIDAFLRDCGTLEAKRHGY